MYFVKQKQNWIKIADHRAMPGIHLLVIFIKYIYDQNKFYKPIGTEY